MQFQEKADAASKAIEALGVALTDDGLFGRLDEINRPLQQEAEEHAARAKTLRESHQELQPRVESRVRVLSREIDAALSEGRDEDADEKRQESTGLKAKLKNILSEADACERRGQELAERQKQNYRAVFEETYPAIRENTVAVEIALVALLDKVWGDLQRFGQESGLMVGLSPLVRPQHQADLTPRESGPEKVWFGKLRDWFGGRF